MRVKRYVRGNGARKRMRRRTLFRPNCGIWFGDRSGYWKPAELEDVSEVEVGTVMPIQDAGSRQQIRSRAFPGRRRFDLNQVVRS